MSSEKGRWTRSLIAEGGKAVDVSLPVEGAVDQDVSGDLQRALDPVEELALAVVVRGLAEDSVRRQQFFRFERLADPWCLLRVDHGREGRESKSVVSLHHQLAPPL